LKDNLMDKNLCEQVAEQLTGRKVDVRFQDPPYKTALGCVIKNMAGEAIVYIRPSIFDDEEVNVLLHECGHIRAHWSQIPASNSANLEPRSVANDQVTRLGGAAYMDKEDEADKLKDEWIAYANSKFTYIWPSPEQQLKVLLYWRPAEIQKK
jgi:hypothetical protein